MIQKMILTDGDYEIDLNNVKSAYCTLEKVTYKKKPTQDDYAHQRHNVIDNISTFYIGRYYLVTDKPEGFGATEHDITKYLWKQKALRKGWGANRELYSIANSYESLQKFKQGMFPKDLFYPIKQFINNPFFNDDYRIKDFYVKSRLNIKAK